MYKGLLISIGVILLTGCAISPRVATTDTPQPTTIQVEKPKSSVFISPTVYKKYTCEELNDEYIGVSKASLNNLLTSVDNLSTRYRETAIEKYSRTTKAQSLENKADEFEAREYAIAKAASKAGCQMYINNKKIVLKE